MKAVILMFDTLRRDKLPNYNSDVRNMPNFTRLGERTVKFDNFYVGSMPCMPARRDLHTGRLNFLHRGWGPLEPFDDSIFEMLKKQGIYTHLITDHQHYWEDGGATYHNRYSSYEFVRGQEGDLWKAKIGDRSAETLESFRVAEPLRQNMIRHDMVNRSYIKQESDYPQAQCYQLGLEFLQQNYQQDNWLLQIECFDPHEPFSVPERFKMLVDPDLLHSEYDWPEYCSTEKVNNDKKMQHGEKNYQALMMMCDEYLGTVLDFFDLHDLWRDTLLIVNTDHGFLFGEKEWSGKSVMPVYNEIAHIPFFIWHPQIAATGTSCQHLAQMHNVSVTLLDFFDVPRTASMTGQGLAEIMTTENTSKHEAVIFGYFGAHVAVTDGRYVYMRGSANYDNQPLYEYTLMPMHMRRLFNCSELQDMVVKRDMKFSKGFPVIKIPGSAGFYRSWSHGHLLFDLHNDPQQQHPLREPEQEAVMIRLLCDCLIRADAPADEWRRLGLPDNVTSLCAKWVEAEQLQRSIELRERLGELATCEMHPDTLTLVLDIAQAGGQMLLAELAQRYSGQPLRYRDVYQVWLQGQYPEDLTVLFNQAY